MKIGFIGLGRMGTPMALRLAAAGYRLTVFTRNPQKRRAFANQHQVPTADSVAELASTNQVILTMLADDDAVEDVYFHPENRMMEPQSSGTWIEMSTISPTLSRRLAQAAHQSQKRYLDAPVSGSVDAAAAGRLVFIVGSQEQLAPEISALLLTMGKGIHLMGPPGSGHSGKLLINSAIHSQNQIVAEITCLARTLEIDIEALIALLIESAAGSPMIKFRQSLYTASSQAVPFALKLAAKDMRLTNELAARQNVQLPQIHLNSQLLQQAAAAGYGEADMSAMCAYIGALNSQGEKV